MSQDRYTLTASRRGKTARALVYGENSLEATIGAITKIVNRAADSKLWARGHIILKDKNGKILREMPEKKLKEGA